MFVEVTATYDRATEAFVLQSPDKGGVKNWISQVYPTYPFYPFYRCAGCAGLLCLHPEPQSLHH